MHLPAHKSEYLLTLTLPLYLPHTAILITLVPLTTTNILPHIMPRNAPYPQARTHPGPNTPINAPPCTYCFPDWGWYRQQCSRTRSRHSRNGPMPDGDSSGGVLLGLRVTVAPQIGLTMRIAITIVREEFCEFNLGVENVDVQERRLLRLVQGTKSPLPAKYCFSAGTTTLSTTRFVNSNTLSNSQNEYNIIFSIIRKYVNRSSGCEYA
jgi:hypothetical protein